MKFKSVTGYNILFKGPEDSVRELLDELFSMKLQVEKHELDVDAAFEQIPIVAALRNPDNFGLQLGQMDGVDFVAGPIFSYLNHCVVRISLRPNSIRSLSEVAFSALLEEFWKHLGSGAYNVSLYGASAATWVAEFASTGASDPGNDFFNNWSWPFMIVKEPGSLNHLEPHTKEDLAYWERLENGMFGVCVWPIDQLSGGLEGAYAYLGARTGLPDFWSGTDSEAKYKRFR